MKRVIEIPCTIGDKVYAKHGGKIREFEVSEISVFIYKETYSTLVTAFIEAPDPFVNDGRTMMRKFEHFRIAGKPYERGTRCFLTPEEAEEYYAKPFLFC
jgi:hypothetical protein